MGERRVNDRERWKIGKSDRERACEWKREEERARENGENERERKRRRYEKVHKRE